MKVNGAPHNEYAFRPAAATITYSLEYELECARIFAGMSLAEWEALPGTRQWLKLGEQRCKADLLILYRMSNFIPAASSDAQARASELKLKRGGR